MRRETGALQEPTHMRRFHAQAPGREPMPDPSRPASRALTLFVIALVLGGFLIGTMNLGGAIVYLPYGAIGGLLAIRRPRTAMGWLLIGIGLAFVTGSMPAVVSADAIQ